MRKYQKNLKVGWRDLIAQFHSQKLNFCLISKEIRKDITTLQFCLVLLNFFLLLQTFVKNVSKVFKKKTCVHCLQPFVTVINFERLYY